jgi:D-galactarolactone cycloisomerase
VNIISVEALIIRIPRSRGGADRIAPFPTRKFCPAIPGEQLETVLARIGTDAGLTGWGESQALAAPDVAGAIIHSVLKPVLDGREFNGTGLEIESPWNAMYGRMRVCGQTGGFMLDAIAALDIALWDLAGKIQGAPISALIAGCRAKTRVDSYVNYLSGDTAAARLQAARLFRDAGCRRFKIFHQDGERELLDGYDALAEICGPENIAVDAQWRLDPKTAAQFGAELDRRNALWLECPFPPEDPKPHAALASHIKTPIALGESYRTHFELAPFFRARGMRIVQPDLGRCGISEALRIARAAERAGMEIVPHLTPALGPLLFATLQFAAAVPNCRLVPHTPGLVETANEFATAPVMFRDGQYMVPNAPGLGTELVEPEVRLVEVA